MLAAVLRRGDTRAKPRGQPCRMNASAAAPNSGPIASPAPTRSPSSRRPHDTGARVGTGRVGRATRAAQVAFVVAYVVLFIPDGRAIPTDILPHGVVRDVLNMTAYMVLFVLGCFAFHHQIARSA